MTAPHDDQPSRDMDTLNAALRDLRSAERIASLESIIAGLTIRAEQAEYRLQQANAACARVEPRAEWRTIAEAPRDGTIVMVYPPTWGGAVSCAKWDGDIYSKRPKPYWRRLDDENRISYSRSNPPTHWRPVPPGPDGCADSMTHQTDAHE